MAPPRIRLVHLHLYLCLCHLLLAAAFAGRLPPSTLTAAAAYSEPECYKTVTQAPKECAGEFIQAIFTGKKEFITDACCVELACVREWTCADSLRRFCQPPEANQCDPSSSSSPALSPARAADVYA